MLGRAWLAVALALCANGALGFAPPCVRPYRARLSRTTRRRAAEPTMGVLQLLDRLFGTEQPKAVAVSRLNLMLASDRAALDGDTLVKIRNGIIELVQQYVDIQADDVILNISQEDRKSILTASLAIKGRKLATASISPPPAQLVADEEDFSPPDEPSEPTVRGVPGLY